MKQSIFILCIIANLFFSEIIAQNSSELDVIFNQWSESDPAKPGLAVGVIKDGEIIYQKTFGYANLEYKISIDKNSIFDAASIAKQFTGFAVAKLITEKKITLEDNVVDYIPELKGLGDLAQNIQVRHLVYHTSGLRDVVDIFDLAQFGSDLTTIKALQIISRQNELNFDIGSTFAYSNTNYVLLALLVERIEQTSFVDWCGANIFRPLNMNNTFINTNPKKIIENRAVAYYQNDKGYSFDQNNGMSLMGSSSLYSSIEDMLKWAIALDSEERFKDIFQLMKIPGTTEDGKSIGYGFGLGIGEFQGMTEIKHTGSTSSGFRSLTTWFPDEKLAIVMLSNFGNFNNLFNEFGVKIVNTLFPSKGYNQNREETAEATNTQHADLSTEDLERFTGHFILDYQQKLEIIREGKTLKLKPEGHDGELPIIPINKHTLEIPAFRSILEFAQNNEGRLSIGTIFNGQHKVGDIQRIEKEDRTEIELNTYTGNYYSKELDMHIKVKEYNNELLIDNAKFGEMKLLKRTNKIFIPIEPLASNLIFKPNNHGQMNSFLLNNGNRLMNIKFIKFN